MLVGSFLGLVSDAPPALSGGSLVLRRVPGYTLGPKVNEMTALRPLLTILGVRGPPAWAGTWSEKGNLQKNCTFGRLRAHLCQRVGSIGKFNFWMSPGTLLPKSGIYRKAPLLDVSGHISAKKLDL